MSDYSMTVDIPRLEEQLRKIEGYEGPFQRHLKTGMTETVTMIASKITPLVPVGVSGRLKNSIGSEVREEGIGSVIGKVGSSLKDEEYPAVMEFGREPGSMPPPDALVRWVHVKGLAGVRSIKTHRRLGGKKQQADEDMQVAWMIARAIARRGIKGRFYMKRGLEAGKGGIPRIFKRETDLLMEELSIGR